MAQAISKHRRLRAGKLRCGYVSRDKPWWVHITGVFIALVTFLFSYAALMQDGILHAVASFLFGFAFLLLIYGHHLDAIYVHIGDNIKIGAESHRRDVRVEFEDEDD